MTGRDSLLLPRRAVLAGFLCIAACDGFPRDSDGALTRINRERRVRVGAVEHPPWVRLGGGTPAGIEAALVVGWARSRNAEVAWRTGALDPLTEALHARELDLLIAGLEEKTPYAARLALTQPYLSVNIRGRRTERVLAVQPGESALLLSVDRWLLAQDEAALRRAAEAAR